MATTVQHVRFRDVKPYEVPESLDALCGPAEGLLELPVRIFWAPDRSFDLSAPSDIPRAYEAVVTEGLAEDQCALLNRDLLIQVWPLLRLDRRVRELWESRFSELR